MPQVGCDCAVCTSADPRDQRTRTSAFLELGGTRLLIDTPPELRLQLVRAGIRDLDAVLYTHEHSDHTSGMDDLRIFSVRKRETVPLYGPARALQRVRTMFPYIFDPEGPTFPGTSRPLLDLRPLEAGVEVHIGGVPVLPLAFEHGHIEVFGYRVGPVAYVTDVKRVPPEARARLAGVRVLVLSALWWRPHTTHLSIPEAIETAQAIGAERTYLTHLTHETAHAELAAQLPPGIAPAYDGLVVEL